MTGDLDPSLVPTDSLLDIWSREGRASIPGQGGLHPLEAMKLMHEGQVLGPEQLSPDAVMIIVDQTVIRSPVEVKAFINEWYKSRAPSHVKAARLGLSRTGLYTKRTAYLWFMRGKFSEKGLRV